MGRKLIEVALPLDAINAAAATEKSIRKGHPSTLHLWWARRPLAACRAVLFASLVDDPSSDSSMTAAELHAELPEALRLMQQGNIAPVGLAQASAPSLPPSTRNTTAWAGSSGVGQS